MRNTIAIIFLLFAVFASSANAAATDRITATIAVTNAPLGNTNKITINGNVRSFTNSVTASPGTLIQQTNSIPWTATNLLDHLTAYRVSQFHFLGSSASTNVRITGAVGEALTVTLAGGWGNVTYTTQSVSSPTIIVRVPLSVEPTSNRTLVASELVKGISDNSTNAFATNAMALSNFITKGASEQQKVTSPIQLSGTVGISIGSLTNVAIYNGTNRGFIAAVTNGYWTNGVLDSPKATNMTAYNISSPGGGASSEQFGSGANAYSDYTTAFGAAAIATNQGATSFGYTATASESGTAIGGSGTYAGTNTVSIGSGVSGRGIGNTLIGAGADDNLYNNVIVIGAGIGATAANQVTIGDGSQIVAIGGPISGPTLTNSTFRGTNTFNGRLDATPRANTALANGYNSAVVFGTNLWVEFSGPSAAYTNAGFAAPGGPQLVWGQFDNPGLSFTILNESGIEATAANRITTETGGLLNSTNRTVFVGFKYDTTTSRWRVISFR